MSLLALAGTNSATGGYDIDNSCKFEADNSEYMDRVITTQGDQKTFTISAWVKRTEVNSSADGFGHTFFFSLGDTLIDFIGGIALSDTFFKDKCFYLRLLVSGHRLR